MPAQPVHPKPCTLCGHLYKPLRVGLCRRCYDKRAYRQNPAKYKAAANAWEKRNREKRNAIVERWRQKTGRAVPAELRQLRAAVKALEKAVAVAEVRARRSGPGQRRGDDAAE